MKNYVYVLYNKLSARYESIVVFPSDSSALYKLKGVDKNEYELCRIGTIDVDTGIIESNSPVRLVWDIEEEKKEA